MGLRSEGGGIGNRGDRKRGDGDGSWNDRRRRGWENSWSLGEAVSYEALLVNLTLGIKFIVIKKPDERLIWHRPIRTKGEERGWDTCSSKRW